MKSNFDIRNFIDPKYRTTSVRFGGGVYVETLLNNSCYADKNV